VSVDELQQIAKAGGVVGALAVVAVALVRVWPRLVALGQRDRSRVVDQWERLHDAVRAELAAEREHYRGELTDIRQRLSECERDRAALRGELEYLGTRVDGTERWIDRRTRE
jgi:hypothetical protein